MAPQTRSALRDKTIQNTPKAASPKPKPKARKKGKAKSALSKPKRRSKLIENLDEGNENQDETQDNNKNRDQPRDEDYDENQDENAHDSDAENSNVIIRSNVGDSPGKPLKPRHKVFQDITDRFVAPAPPSPLELTPSRHTPRSPLKALGRPRRKPKVPSITVKPTPRKIIPSSLPPSSPPSASSRPTFDIKAPVFVNPFDDDEDDGGLNPLQNSDFGTDLPPLASPRLAPTPPPYNDNTSSDPFGFLALEKKLKAQRETNPHPIQSNFETLNTSSSHELPVLAAHPPASPLKRSTSSSPPLISTPIQNGRKRAKRKWSSIDPNSNRSSMPSSPSPMKRRQNPEKEAEIEEVEEAIDEDDGEAETETEKEKEKRPAKKPRGSGDPVDPIGLAKSLTALLPKRPNARAKRGRKKVVVENDSDDEEEDVKPKGKGKGKGKAVYKGKAKANALDMDEDIDDEEREKWAQEREARREYFKKLEGYVVAKENVYIV